MKNAIIHSHYLFIATLAILISINHSMAQGTAFTYQGQLNTTNGPANGNYDLTFSLYNASTGGSQTGNTLTNLAVSITNGLFTSAVDFGAVYNGTTYWLQVGVRINGGGTFTPLTPRQQLTPTPYAVYAESAGSSALISDTGTQNLFAGQYAGNGTLTGTHNTGVGYSALSADTLGVYNTAEGDSALGYDTSGGNNTADGVYALWKNSTGNGNSAFGADVLAYNNGGNNTAIGLGALENNTLGSNNVAAGAYALGNNSTDNGLVAIGYQALQNDAVVGSFFGSGGNTAVGFEALMANTSGSGNTALGWYALQANVSGYNNTASGWLALASNSGNNNTANGFSALSANSTGANNTAYGQGALSGNTTAGNNTAIGAGAMQGDSNVTGGGNTASGGSALADLTTGYNNTAAGYEALAANQDGVDNVGIGVATFQALDGSENTGVGTYSFQLLTSGTGNIGLGYHAGYSLTSGNNNIYIGNLGNTTESGIIRIGTPGTQTGAYLAGSLWLDGNDTLNGLTYLTSGLTGVPGGAGPFLYGYNGGSLGTSDPNQPALSWNYDGNVWISNGLSTATLTIRGGADLAEPFKIAAGKTTVPQGAVVVIDDQNPGQLKLTDEPYDTRVAGVVSGANGINPGIQMHQQGLLDGGRNVALSGRVYVQADTSNGAIKPGDLLTTSSIPGRAMRVSDHLRAQGAILGKAMSALNEGQGMVLVLVTLQ